MKFLSSRRTYVIFQHLHAYACTYLRKFKVNACYFPLCERRKRFSIQSDKSFHLRCENFCKLLRPQMSRFNGVCVCACVCVYVVCVRVTRRLRWRNFISFIIQCTRLESKVIFAVACNCKNRAQRIYGYTHINIHILMYVCELSACI